MQHLTLLTTLMKFFTSQAPGVDVVAVPRAVGVSDKLGSFGGEHEALVALIRDVCSHNAGELPRFLVHHHSPVLYCRG